MGVPIQYGVRFVGFLSKVVLLLLTPIFWIASLKPRKRIPPITDKLLLINATELATKIRSGRIKSENVVRAYINRIQEVNPIVNAVIEDNFKAAIEEARAVDLVIAKREKPPDQLAKEKPLFGVPVTVKESCSVKGLSLTGSLVLRKGLKADKDGDAVALIRQAGAIILAVTNIPELCMSSETSNLLFGRTLNPYDTNRTTAGSSGGEAALVTTGASIVGIASDLGGSLRVPAMFNGIFGHKPTAYVVPFEGHFPYCPNKDILDLSTIGPMARYAQDMKLVMKVLVKNKENLLNLDEKVDINKLNVFYKDSAGQSLVTTPVDGEIKKVLYNVVNFLKTLGVRVSPADFLDLDCKQEICLTYLSLLKHNPEVLMDTDKSLVSKNLIVENLKAFFGLSNFTPETITLLLIITMNSLIPQSKVSDYLEEAKRMRQFLGDFFGDNSIFLYPTFPTPAFQHKQWPFFSDGLFYSMIVNIWGFPATHVPLGLNKAGLPIGIQVIAGPNQDRLCLAVAEELEKKFGGWISPMEVVTD